MKPKFELGQIVATPGVIDFLGDADINPLHLIARHVSGDWGDLGTEDKETNDAAVRDGDRILSMYRVNGTKIYVITEWDRSATTVLLASEY